MSRLQVLVATMSQTDFSLTQKMNIKCDAIIANQSDKCTFEEMCFEEVRLKMITTNTIGVGLNRNIALLASDADIVLFADDDISYYDGTLKAVKDAFERLPKADVIIFSADLVKQGEIYEKRHLPIKRLHMWNAMKYGAYVIAARRSSLLKANISFSRIFGGGCIYGSGEDSLFIRDCFKNKLKVYSHSYVLGKCVKDTSSWFVGFGDKYFFDRGAFFNYAFPKAKFVIIPFFALKMMLRKKTELLFFSMIRRMFIGAKASNGLLSYKEWSKNYAK